MTTPFVIFALPRSRTAWLSRFLSYGDWSCGHDELRHVRSLDDVKAWLSQPCTGTVETAAAPFWRLLPPDARVVTIRRNVADVIESLMRLPVAFDRSALIRTVTRIDAKLDQIEQRIPGVLSVRYEDLADEATCAALFGHCLPYAHDPAWWGALAPRNIQINMRALMRYYQAHEQQLNKLAKTAKQQALAAMARPIGEMDGLTIQQETFETFFRDGQQLFQEHLVQVGESPDAFWTKNLEIMLLMDRCGMMQITTARCNGRMFGYLMAVIGPSLEVPDMTSGAHMTFFASKEFPGLGMKLQRASVEAMRQRGVGEVILRAGPRGSGPKMGALYRRLGAEDFGQMFRLELRAA